MEFCTMCDNMFYIQQCKEDDILHTNYYCKFCGNTKEFDKDKAMLISRTSFKNDDNIDKWVPADIESDVTLPHKTNIVCIHTDCTKPKNEENDIILVRYNKAEVKYIYYCTYCKKYWKNEY